MSQFWPARSRKETTPQAYRLLLASVSDDESADVDASWEEEIKRRVDAVRAGTARIVSAEDVHAQARRLYQQ